MAQNSKVTKWAKDNQEALYMLYEDGVLTEEQLRTLVNLKGDYDVTKQDAEFDKVKQTIQSKLTDERINSAVKNDLMSDNDAKIYGSLFKSVSSFDDKKGDALLSSKLNEQIKSSGYKDLPLLKGMSEQIKDMSDKDVKEYIYNQRQYLNQMLPGKAIESIPDLQEYLTIPPNYGVKNTDYAKMFNDPDILDKLNEYSFRDIDYIARKNGMSGKELLNDMTEAKIAKDRNLAAHGGRWRDVFDADQYKAWDDNPIASNIGGALLTAFGPRQQEAIARGEEPELKDIAGDVGEQLAYMAPVGRIAGPVAKIGAKISPVASKAASATASIGSNAIVPTASEIYDAVVYDDAHNPRSDFSFVDDAFGTGVNIAGPLGIRMLGNRVGRILDSKDIAKRWGELAEGKSADDVIKAAEAEREFIGRNRLRINQPGTAGDLTPDYYKKIEAAPELTDKSENQLMKALAKEQGVTTPNQQALNTAIRDPHILTKSRGGDKKAGDYLTIYKKNPNPGNNANLDDVYKYDVKEWTQLTKAMKNGEKTYKWHGQNKDVPKVTELKAALDDNFTKNYIHSPYGSSMFLKSSRELLEEDAIKNYLTNQFGNATYGDENVSLPLAAPLNYFGIDINQELKNYRANKERQKAKEESKRRLPTLQDVYGNLK